MTLFALLAQAASLSGAPPVAVPDERAAPPPANGHVLAPETLLLLTVALDHTTLTEGLSAFGGEGDSYYLPVGELSRLLDLDIAIDIAGGRISGRLGAAERPLTIDVTQGFARVGGENLRIAPEDWGRTSSDIFIRADLLAQVLPVTFALDLETLQLTLTATEKLPVQARAERDQRIEALSRPVGGQAPVMQVQTAYALARVPSVDLAFETGYDSRTALFGRRYDVRAAGDLLGSAFSAYLGSDQVGAPSTARVKFERKSATADLLGPLHATYLGLGDVYTPGLPLGPASGSGRGLAVSSTPPNGTEIFQQVTMRGELPIGYQVELYVNDVLRSGQRTPVDGRYEFVDVPLTRGLNVVRVVLYGPHGERSEEVRVLNVGGGQLPRGRFTFDAGISQQGRETIALQDADLSLADAAQGALRGVLSAGYGLSSGTTVRAGLGTFADNEGKRQTLATAGLRTSFIGLATSLDYARDFAGPSAASVAFAGEPLGVSMSGRHTEFMGRFVDENIRLGSDSRPLLRDTALDVSLGLPFFADNKLPLTVRADRAQFSDGADWTGSARASTVVANTLTSFGLDFRHDGSTGVTVRDRLAGNLSLSRLVAYSWQLRSSIDFEALPSAALRSFALTADKAVSEDLSLRFGLGRSFGTDANTQLQTSAAWRLPFGEFALTGDWAIERSEYRVGVRIAFGFAIDPWSRHLRVTRPGVAAGGSAALLAFLDRNANGVRDDGEDPMPGVLVTGGSRAVATDPAGRAWIAGLGEGPTTRLHADSTNIDAFFVESPPQDIELNPRAGTVIAVPYPFAPVSEVFATLRTRDAGGRSVGLSAVRVQLVTDGRPPIAATTEFDGTVIFENVPPGDYRLELDPEQSRRLGMSLPVVVPVRVDAEANPPEVEAEVLFEAVS